MVTINRTNGPGSARFLKPVRAVARWNPQEKAIIEQAAADGLGLDEAHALLPYRTRGSVKDVYYRARPLEMREKLPREKTDFMDEIDYQKDARQGSRKLKEAILDFMAREAAKIPKAG